MDEIERATRESEEEAERLRRERAALRAGWRVVDAILRAAAERAGPGLLFGLSGDPERDGRTIAARIMREAQRAAGR